MSLSDEPTEMPSGRQSCMDPLINGHVGAMWRITYDWTICVQRRCGLVSYWVILSILWSFVILADHSLQLWQLIQRYIGEQRAVAQCSCRTGVRALWTLPLERMCWGENKPVCQLVCKCSSFQFMCCKQTLILRQTAAHKSFSRILFFTWRQRDHYLMDPCSFASLTAFRLVHPTKTQTHHAKSIHMKQ